MQNCNILWYFNVFRYEKKIAESEFDQTIISDIYASCLSHVSVYRVAYIPRLLLLISNTKWWFSMTCMFLE